ncbi:topless-related protein 2 [Quercus suber]|uniref:Topless-related protein 2 n=1 Tax=Quercus suber TaxID=58331 RepID=A0AAW0J6K8_QUESU
MSSLSRELVFLILQFLEEEKFKESVHKENEQLSKYGDTKTARSIMLIELKKLIEANPLFREKLVFPTLKSSRLRTLINQRKKSGFFFNMKYFEEKVQAGEWEEVEKYLSGFTKVDDNRYSMKTFFESGSRSILKHLIAAANANALAGWMANASASSVQASVVTASSIPVPQNQVPILKRPRTPPAAPGMVDYPSTDHEQLMKRLRSAQSVEEVTYPTTRQQAPWSLEDLPRAVAVTLHQGSTVTSMDFHPSHHTLLVVGSSNGEITLWEVASREKLVSKQFKIWEMASCSLGFQASVTKDAPISVSRVTWSPDGNFVGVAFTKHLIHLYAYHGSNDLRQNLEIDAHNGAVNDLAFAHPNKQLCLVSCGDDKLIKVWDSAGRRLFNFEGHEAPVYSICPHHKENIQFIFSTAFDGKIKAWLYDNMGSRVDYDAPGHWCTTMLYSADGSRLFSCGTSKDGDSFLVEWNESEGAIKRSYIGFRKKSAGVVQFDTTQNHFLAAGEDSQIKFWDMDNNNILASTEADGGLPSLPRLRFNKEGNLLAVTTADNGFKILANAAGLRSLRPIEPPSFEALRSPIESAAAKVSGSPAITNVNPVNCKVERSSPVRPSPIINGVDPNGEAWKSQEPWRMLFDFYMQILALGFWHLGQMVFKTCGNGHGTSQKSSGTATANVVPQHWQPNSGLLMANDVSGVNLEESVPCVALSKNDS